MRTIIVDGAASQRRILSLLLETECSVHADSVDSPEAASPYAESDRVFLDASFSVGSVAPAGVIVTGAAKQDELLARRIREGASTFLVKPYMKETFLRALDEAALMANAAGSNS
ncbi:MAG: hypothetical protein AAB229_00895 [Candidatus Hydrogenedentota bacterium]